MIVETVKFGSSLDKGLFEKLDNMIQKKKDENGSKAIKDLIRDFMIKRELEKLKGQMIGAFTLIYSHDVRWVRQQPHQPQNSNTWKTGDKFVGKRISLNREGGA